MTELKVGEYFKYCGKKYIVVEDATGNCWNCAFGCPHVWLAHEWLLVFAIGLCFVFMAIKQLMEV